MRALLEIMSGHLASRRIRLEAGALLRVGRAEPCELVLPQEEHLAAAHFALEFDGASCRLQVLPGAPEVQLEGQPVREARLEGGMPWVAGQTWFCVHMRPPAEAPRLSGLLLPLLERLRATPAPLFALLEAARDSQVLALLRASDEESQSLYEGLQGQLLSEQAPYLVQLTPESAFLPTLLQQGWGKSWGIFLTSRLPFAEVRRHWRRFLFVQDAAGRELYLRFYEPRVLRGLLPALSTAQAAAFFEGMDSLLLEEKGARELLNYTWRQGQPVREREELGPGASDDEA